MITLDEIYDDYRIYIDEVSEPIELMGMTYSASAVLEDVDPVAYRCGFNDWIDAEVQEGRYDEEELKEIGLW